ncbi:Isoamyl acetate-hydrolyzing esterase 1-like [Cricetulus griseus]|uniref:Isoamyl acetate-hydrolyzing esterase 1 homolog n=1 Tax=Cricetulus griseus TaxID=10029 RepID=G3IHH9_CRIGR|nr:Isoamyl acetate-hydrolyzing esterase 1-like [Cricetulus griseus]ERE68390.1 putative isoamyl acetate-hydrolyzing esterase 1 like protein [Cricetulus griseus]
MESGETRPREHDQEEARERSRLAPPSMSPPPQKHPHPAQTGCSERATMALCERAASGSSLLWPRVVLFGDSITQVDGAHCWLTDLSGYNTRWAKIILPRLISKGSGMENPVAVTVFFGANDATLKDENPKQHVPLDEYSANLRAMVQYLRSVDILEERVILITPPPLGEAAWEKECILKGCKLNRLNSIVGEYANACLQVARDCGTNVLDLWTLMQKDNQDFSSYLSDGLHLSPKGNEFLFSNLWPLLDKKVSSLPWLLPYWNDVEEAKPERSLLGDGDH